MPRRILSTVIVPALILVIGFIAFYWLRSKSKPPAREPTSPIPPLVQTMQLRPSATHFDIRVGGNVVPRLEVTISAEVTGAIISKAESARGGRHVQKGTPLLRIDPSKYDLAVKEFEGEKKQILEDLRRIDVEETGNKALIEIAEQESRLATQELARLKSLKSKNAATDTEIDRAASAELKARNALRVLHNISELIPVRRERLQVQKSLVELRRQQAVLDHQRTNIVAPFDGVITQDAVEQGDFVQPGDLLLRIEESSSVEVECHLRTDDLYWLWNSGSQDDDEDNRSPFEVPKSDVTIAYDVSGQTFEWKGILSRYKGRGIDRQTRTIPCRVVVSNAKREDVDDGPPSLMRGMYVTVTLNVAPQTLLWRIPNRAIQPNGQIWTVEDGKLRIHRVKAARVLPDSVLIRRDSANLSEGDHLVVTQLATSFDGMLVRESEESGSPSP